MRLPMRIRGDVAWPSGSGAALGRSCARSALSPGRLSDDRPPARLRALWRSGLVAQHRCSGSAGEAGHRRVGPGVSAQRLGHLPPGVADLRGQAPFSGHGAPRGGAEVAMHHRMRVQRPARRYRARHAEDAWPGPWLASLPGEARLCDGVCPFAQRRNGVAWTTPTAYGHVRAQARPRARRSRSLCLVAVLADQRLLSACVRCRDQSSRLLRSQSWPRRPTPPPRHPDAPHRACLRLGRCVSEAGSSAT